MVIFAGYENFVSKIDIAINPKISQSGWVNDFSGLKLKLIASIVAISSITTRSFTDVSSKTSEEIADDIYSCCIYFIRISYSNNGLY